MTHDTTANRSIFSGKPLRILIGFILLVNGMFPALWILFTSLKTEAELTVKPITWLPHAPTIANYLRAFTDQPLLLFLFNSFMVAILSTALTLFISVLAAYALARLQLRGRDLILSAIIAVSTFPLVTLLVPLFEIMRALGLLNTWVALILPYTVLSLPVCTLILVSFFEGIPRDLENSAMIDGCTRIGALFKVVVPLSAPGVFVQFQPDAAHASRGHHALSGRVRLPLAGDLGGTRRRHRAGRGPDRDLPRARRVRPDLRRHQGIRII
jgi:multiple sugar transport system permease protein